ncbi:MAG: LacI family DNA-binding transcriptional regulator [Aquabacterium sp.]
MARPAAPADNPLPRIRRGHGRVTLRDVALACGVTAITVSRFLREPERVAPETAARIRQAIADTGYMPNRQAGLLASGRSRMVAALIPNLANSIFGETVQALAEVLQAAGYELMLASTRYSLQREEEQVRAVLAWAPSALVLTGRHHTAGTRALLQQALAAGTPVVEIWDLNDEPLVDVVQVGFDHAGAGRDMAAHLLRRGHQSLAYLDSALPEDFRAHERGAGFMAAAQAAGATVRLLHAAPGDAYEAGRQALRGPWPAGRAAPPFTALACANDHLACGVLLEAAERRLAVPGALAVLGFGDFAIGAQMQPPLTTLAPPREAIGRVAAEMLVAALEQGEPPADRALPWTWVERASTG